jgi:hypothetical protein
LAAIGTVVLTALAYNWLQDARRRAGARLRTLPVARAVITEILTAHFFVTTALFENHARVRAAGGGDFLVSVSNAIRPALPAAKRAYSLENAGAAIDWDKVNGPSASPTSNRLMKKFTCVSPSGSTWNNWLATLSFASRGTE